MTPTTTHTQPTTSTERPKPVVPAFPVTYEHEDATAEFHGMDLRDYFAAKALPTCLAEAWGEEDGTMQAAIGAYQVADAMIAARNGGAA